MDHGRTPDELWTESHSDHHDLCRAHVFGCPVYVLEPALQDGKKIPKWNSRARQGVFLGFSPHHSSLAPLVLNRRTGKVSPQYHVIFDDKFQTVSSGISSEALNGIWLKLFKRSREVYLDDEVDVNGKPTFQYPQLDDDWLTPDEVIQRSLARDGHCRPPRSPPPASLAPPQSSLEASDSSVIT
ncbi:hypothetical protein ACHAXS_000018, partial [Conticribra weissflogii]